MIRRYKRRYVSALLSGSLGLLLLTEACNQAPADTRAADEKAIRDQDDQWAKAVVARDLDATVGYYTDDASLLSPNAPIANTKATIRAVWAALLAPDVTLPPWQITKVDVASSGDLGYVLGVYDMTSKNPQGKVTADQGKLLEVWRKQADGKWKVVADIFNSDLAAPAPAEPKK